MARGCLFLAPFNPQQKTKEHRLLHAPFELLQVHPPCHPPECNRATVIHTPTKCIQGYVLYKQHTLSECVILLMLTFHTTTLHSRQWPNPTKPSPKPSFEEASVSPQTIQYDWKQQTPVTTHCKQAVTAICSGEQAWAC